LKVAGLEIAVVEAMREHPPQKGYVVSSFLPEVLGSMHKKDPALRLGYICDDAKRLPLWRELPVEVVIPHYGLADAALVHELHEAGKQVFVWTVNRAPEMKRMAELGVDAIISDDTKLLCRTMRPR
jgi:glycerophosphoryl diester phosphodiesterase